ncbi:MAG: LytTR family transcriptional regulator DNA-binding domain-containing protein [Dokdonella sp.]
MPSAPLRAIIVDDEVLARLALRQALQHYPDFEIVAECANAREAEQALETLAPDALFIDVQMPGVSGIKFLGALPEAKRPATVYVTAFSEHALAAFDVCAIDYLLKPIDQDRFDVAVRRLRERLLPGVRWPAVPVPDAREIAAPVFSDLISVRDGERIHVIRPQDIDWLRADGNYVHIHAGPLRVMHRATLQGMLQQLNPKSFLRIHRATLVNVDRIAEIHPMFRGGGEMVLRDGTRLTLSRRYRQAARTVLGLS